MTHDRFTGGFGPLPTTRGRSGRRELHPHLRPGEPALCCLRPRPRWWARRGSHPRPSPCDGDALLVELRARDRDGRIRTCAGEVGARPAAVTSHPYDEACGSCTRVSGLRDRYLALWTNAPGRCRRDLHPQPLARQASDLLVVLRHHDWARTELHHHHRFFRAALFSLSYEPTNDGDCQTARDRPPTRSSGARLSRVLVASSLA